MDSLKRFAIIGSGIGGLTLAITYGSRPVCPLKMQ
jgi:predicted NAD/FAD-binding protein